MRIRAVHIDGFGVFHDARLDGLSPGLNLLVGENEAGKSTFLAFLRTILFGFPDRRTRERHYPPLAGGRPGGSLVLDATCRGTIRVERRPGSHGGEVIIQQPDGGRAGPLELSDVLGPVTRELFRNVYAFGLEELQDVDSLQDDAITSALYAAGSGVGVRALPAAEKLLQDRLDALFRPRARKPILNRKLHELESVRSRLAEASHGLEAYSKAVAELHETETRLKRLVESRDALFLKMQRIKRLREAWPDWLRVLEAEENLDAVAADTGFPENGVARFEALIDQRRGMRQDLARLEKRLTLVRKRWDDLAVDDDLLRVAPRLQVLHDQRRTFQNSLTNVSRVRHEINSLNAHITELFTSLGPDWSEARLKGTDLSLASREAVHGFEDRLGIARRELDRRTAVREGRQRDFHEVRELIEHAGKRCLDERERGQVYSPAGIVPSVTALAEVEAGGVQARREAASAEKPEPELEDDRPAASNESVGNVLGAVSESTLRELRLKRDEYVGAMERGRHLQQAVRREARKLSRDVEALGVGWTLEGIRRFDTSRTSCRRIDACVKEGERFQQSRLRLEAELSWAGRTVEVNTSRWRTIQDALESEAPGISLEELQRRQNALERIERLFEATRSAQERLAAADDRRRRLADAAACQYAKTAVAATWFCRLLGGAFILAGCAVLWLQNAVTPASPTGVAVVSLTGGGILAMLLAGWFGRRLANWRRGAARFSDLMSLCRRETDSLQVRIFDIGDSIQSSAEQLGLEVATESALRRARKRLVEQEQRTAKHKQIQEQEIAARQARDQAIEHHDAVAAQLESNAEEEQASLVRWRDFVSNWGAPAQSLTPADLAALLPHIVVLKDRVQRLEQQEKQLRDFRDAEHRLRAFLADVSGDASCRGMSAHALRERIDEFLEGVADAKRKLVERERKRRELNERCAKVERALKEARRAEQEAQRVLGRIEGEWRRWLEERGFTPGMRPATARECFETCRKLKEALAGRDEKRAELKRLQRELDQYRSQATACLRETGHDPPDDVSLPATMEMLWSRAQQARAYEQERKHLTSRASELRADCDAKREALAGLTGERNELMRAAGTEDAEAFLRRGREVAQRRKLLSERDAAWSAVRAASGARDEEPLRQELDESTCGQLEASLNALARNRNAQEAELERLRQRRADLNSHIARLSSEDLVGDLRLQEENLRSEIDGLAREWSVHALARQLLNDAKRQFEEEQQPAVLHRAARHFSSITGQRYARILAPVGQESLEAERAEDGQRLSTSALSRGTAEQLYLAIRFGYIDNVAREAGSLPVVMDDILVNFDPGRCRAAVRCIAKLAHEHQVLFFTCHPEMVDMFREFAPRCPAWWLSGEEGVSKTMS